MTILTSMAPVVSATGITAPAYSDILQTLQSQYQGIYGADVYLGADSQDGQFLAIIASAINDCNAAAVAVYNAFSPSTAQGNGLSSVIKINGMTRLPSSNSTASLTISGQVGTTISNGIAADANGNQWALPASVTIPAAGFIVVTANCTAAGAVVAASGTITQISTPTLGWQAVTNGTAASPGQALETDSKLRQRQSVSTALPSLTVLQGIVGAVAALPNVTRYAAYENDTGITDTNGLLHNTIALVVEGGDQTAIAVAIAGKKTPGTGTMGNVTQTVQNGNITSNNIAFYRPTAVPITVVVNLKALSGYTSAIGAQVQAAISAYINALAIGQAVFLSRLYLPANLSGGAGSGTFEILSILIAPNAGTPVASDVPIAFNAAATCTVPLVTLNVS